jgi:hypothetical protein
VARFPVRSASTTRVRNSEQVVENELSSQEWGVVVGVKVGPLESFRTQFGVAPDALDGKDHYDLASLPKVFSYADLSFHRDDSYDYTLMKDIIETSTNGKWIADFESNLENELVTLEWDNTYWGNNDLTIVLFDRKREKLIDMREQSSYQFKNTGKQQFEFIYGTEQFIKENVVPTQINVSTYPNPFRGETTIEFSLPATKTSYGVTLSIYNSTGQWVTTLVDDVFTEGFYSEKWDGRNNSGTELNPGMYIFKMVATDESGSKVESGRLIIR